MSTKSLLFVLAIAACFGSVSPAFAHGDEEYAALGEPGDAKQADRTVSISMSDEMRFTPSSVTVKQGQTILFRLTNTGKVKHEMVIGTAAQLKEHAALMQKFPEMEHSDPNQASVEPGKTGRLTWRFTKAGTFDFACLQPGHFEAGMHGTVTVLASAGTVDHTEHKTVASSPDATSSSMTSGEVKKIDKDAGKITIKHDPIANLGMPGMTMLFHVKDPAMLDQVKEGDKIKFTAERADGALTVTKIEEAQ
ncbi:MAG: copper-binding protein [Candidatus Acidiferrales bacterium]